MENIKTPETIGDLLAIFTEYVEHQRNRPLTIIEFQNYEKKLNEMSEGEFDKAKDIVNYSMERKIINFREPSKNYLNSKKQNIMSTRDIPDDELNIMFAKKSQMEIEEVVKEIRSEIFGSEDEYNKMSIKERQERRELWRQKVLM
jgi:hypothetical protein